MGQNMHVSVGRVYCTSDRAHVCSCEKLIFWSKLPLPRSESCKTSSLRSARGLALRTVFLNPISLRASPHQPSLSALRRNGWRSLMLLLLSAHKARLALPLRAGEGAVQPWCRAALAVRALAWAISVELMVTKKRRGRRVRIRPYYCYQRQI